MRTESASRLARVTALATAALALAVTVARALRAPNGYATAHWLLDYDLGFVRRGLPGTILRIACGGQVTSVAITTVSFLLLAALAGLCLALCDRMLSRCGGSPRMLIITVAFLSSPFWVMNAHLSGYFDTIAYAAQIIALLLLRSGFPRSGILLIAATVFAHENILVTGLPLLLLAWTGGWRVDRAGRPVHGGWIGVPVFFFLMLAVAGTHLVQDNYPARLAEHLREFPFLTDRWDKHLPAWLSENFWIHFERARPQALYRLQHAHMHGLMLPACFALAGAAVECGRLGRRPFRLLTLLAAISGPLCLHFIAWDMARFWTVILMQAFVACWIVLDQTRRLRRIPDMVVLLAALAFLLNVIRVCPLYDGQEELLNLKTRVLFYAPCAAGLALHAFLRSRVPRPTPDRGDSA